MTASLPTPLGPEMTTTSGGDGGIEGLVEREPNAPLLVVSVVGDELEVEVEELAEGVEKQRVMGS